METFGRVEENVKILFGRDLKNGPFATTVGFIFPFSRYIVRSQLINFTMVKFVRNQGKQKKGSAPFSNTLLEKV